MTPVPVIASSERLEQLARACGIQPHYHDIWGHLHVAPDSTRLALLAALGLKVTDDASIELLLRELADRPWREVLPPVRVVRDHEFPITIEAILPESMQHETVEWRLVTESRETHCDTAHLRDWDTVARHVLDGTPHLRKRFHLEHHPGWGYHRFCLEIPGTRAEMNLIVVPQTCHVPESIARGDKVWGLAVQLYGVRSADNWGIGDFRDLARLVDLAADHGAEAVGLNPLHALFPHNPAHCSPYDPSSRRFLAPWYIAVDAVPEFAECAPAQDMVRRDEFRKLLFAARQSELVDYPAVMALKLPVLRLLYGEFRARHLEADNDRAREFRRFQSEQGPALHRYSLFEALQEKFYQEHGGGFETWPAEFQNPHTPAAVEFALANKERLEFYQYLQWQAQSQLEAAAARAEARGMTVGIYCDLALSVNPAGADAWSDREIYAPNIALGAPPDDFNLKGQEWGVAPMVPEFLRATGYAPFAAALRANMRFAGALRLDHVMSLYRQFWVPRGVPPTEGAYVEFPLGDLAGIVALESRDNRCLVVGEDLGTVPDAIRDAMRDHTMFSYRVLYFEKHWEGDGGFKRPGEFPPFAATTVSTHDLPTLAGFWESRDVELRDRLDLFPSPTVREQQIVRRSQDRYHLLAALRREGLLAEHEPQDPAAYPKMTTELALKIHRYLARSAARLMMVQVEDILGQTDSANVPGTTDQHPNWRRKLSVTLEELTQDPRLHTFTRALNRERRDGLI